MPILRTRLAPALAAAALLMAACGDDGSSGDEAAASAADAPSGEWTYTDGSGQTATLDETPTRIVAHGSSAAALISFGIEPVGIYADTAIEDDLALQDLDLEGIEIVGEEWGVINVEAVAALEPDLIVSEWWPVEEGYSGMEEGTNYETMSQIAPVVGVAQGPSIVQMLEDYADLATSLGADLDDTAVADAGERFDAAVAAFRRPTRPSPTCRCWPCRPLRKACTSPCPSTPPSSPTSSSGASVWSCPSDPTPASSTGRPSAGRTPTPTRRT